MITYAGGFRRHPTTKETHRYMMGECAYFALAMARSIEGSQMVLLNGAHFAVRDPAGHFWDIRGRLSESQVWDGVLGAAQGHQIRLFTREQVIAELATGIYSDGPYLAHRERQARRLVADLAPTAGDPLPERSGSRPRGP